jgi:putative ATP-dependent endonuclease of OLD family
VSVQRSFLGSVLNRSDYPTACGRVDATTPDGEVRVITSRVLKARKGSGSGYAAILVAECSSLADLPSTLANFLLNIDAELRPSVPDPDAKRDGDGAAGD